MYEAMLNLAPGGLGYSLKLECQIKRLYGRIKRQFYASRPTRKYRRLLRMETRLNTYLDGPAVGDLLGM
jgi:hypothetical protein